MTIFAKYNAYGPSGAPPYLFAKTMDTEVAEAYLYDNILSEFIYLYGSDVVWLHNEVNKAEPIFGEYLAAEIDRGYPMRMFIEETEAWGGSGDMFSKFGLQVTDECTLHINKASFLNASASAYPKQGDLVYINKTQKLFEVTHIENETSPGFYLFGNRTVYRISCKLYSYDHKKINQSVSAGIPEAIQALDALIEDTKTNDLVTLETKEVNNTNAVINQESSFLLDNTENDPLG
ncbi:hypothetical protein GW796_05540 [archaeon]|nr:hypothetical protein [archaeon]NCQ51347.1 hypothetical protein [archaeon]NCT58827.1 hypothetical protein [archaeon]